MNATQPRPALPNPQHPLKTLGTVLLDAICKFDPRYLWRNPVLLITEVGAVLTTLIAIAEPFVGGAARSGGQATPPGFTWALALGFWGCLCTATLAESFAEGRGRAQTSQLRQQQPVARARRVSGYDEGSDPGAVHAPLEELDSRELRPGDVVVVCAGEIIPADGEVLFGKTEIDESVFTGQPDPVIRESTGDRTAVTGGTRDLSDRIVMRVTAAADASQFERTIRLAGAVRRHRPPLEQALSALLASFSISFIVLVLTLNSIVSPVAQPVSVPVLVALVICLIPTEVAALMSVTGIAGMHQLLSRGVLVTSAKALETAGDITTVLLDKTGTITQGNRSAVAFVPLNEASATVAGSQAELVRAAALASAGDLTPEGVSTLQLAESAGVRLSPADTQGARALPFSATTRISGCDLQDGSRVRKGSVSAVAAWLKQQGAQPAREVIALLHERARQIAQGGGTPLVVAIKRPGEHGQALGLIHLQDVLKSSVPGRIGRLRGLGVRTLLITGDHELTAKAVCEAANIDEYVGDTTPKDKLAIILREQEKGHLVAMSGDGVNDAPALAQADIGIAMNTATPAARSAANMIILDDDPAHLFDVITVGRRQLATRGALMVFNFANDVVRYVTLFPALFAGQFPWLDQLNLLRLHSPASAILSTVIFSSLVMGVLIPLALIGVPYRTTNVRNALTKSLIINGISGLVVPIVAIKLIDVLVALLPGY